MGLEGLHHCSEYKLRCSGALFDIVRSISKDFRFNNGNETIFLANGCISGKGVGSLFSSNPCRSAVADLADSPPLSKSASLFVVFLASVAKPIETLGGVFVFSTGNHYQTLVDLDAWQDALGLEQLYEVGTVRSFLI
jgi:hypothetical protein